MGDLFTAPHLIFLGILAVLLFGGKKLPELGKGLGEGLRGFKEGMKGLSDDEAAEIRKKEEEQKLRADMEAKAYQEAKMAAEAKVAAEARLAAEQKPPPRAKSSSSNFDARALSPDSPTLLPRQSLTFLPSDLLLSGLQPAVTR
jgi:sec-independent protein translocase protein TatA